MSAATSVPLIGSAAVLGGLDTPRARRGDLVTSHEAADSNDVTRSLGLVLDVIRSEGTPVTDERIEYVAVVERRETFTGQRLRTARRHLVRLGLVEIADEKGGLTSRGRRCATWRAVQS